MAIGFGQIPHGNPAGIYSTLLKLTIQSKMSSSVVKGKKKVFGRELWKGHSGTYSTFQKVLSFFAMYTKRCVQRDLYKGTSQRRLKNMISNL